MFDFEPGPLELGDFPLGPPVAYDGLFETHAADYLEARGVHADVLPMAAIDVAGDGIPDHAGVYAATLGAAEDTTAEETARATETLPGSVLDAGQNVNGHAAAVAPFLPPPDADVPTNFADPPQPPAGGFNNSGSGGTLPEGDQPNQGPDQTYG